jgi:hypothetical protein
MHWQYWVRGFQAQDKDGIAEQLNEMDKDGWEVLGCWTAPGDRGAYGVFILLRKLK